MSNSQPQPPKLVQVDVAELRVGMYVSKLDRPWLGTPFLFQGFVISSEEELAQFAETCSHVFVDPAECEVSLDIVANAARIGASAIAETSVQAKRFQLFNAMASGAQKNYEDQSLIAEEMPKAKHALDQARTQFTEVLSAIGDGKVTNAEQIKAAVTPLIDSVLRNQNAIAWLVYLKKRDEYTYNRAISTSVWAAIFGRYLGFDRQGLIDLATGGMLLDIGMVRLPDEILHKEGALTMREKMTVRTHVGCGVTIVRQIPHISVHVLDMVAHHHERSDGSGYPKGLREPQIPVYGRIAGLVDCFDAMTTLSPYSKALSPYDAIRELNEMSGDKFQPELIEQFVQAMGMFPSGSIVELNTGEVGIVIEQNRIRRLRPRVMLVRESDKSVIDGERLVNLRDHPSDQHDRDAIWITCGHPHGTFGIDPGDYYL